MNQKVTPNLKLSVNNLYVKNYYKCTKHKKLFYKFMRQFEFQMKH